jgi:cytochrome oxidase Cu insertion factor (SCO1/SenC/PrrC family)
MAVTAVAGVRGFDEVARSPLPGHDVPLTLRIAVAGAALAVAALPAGAQRTGATATPAPATTPAPALPSIAVGAAAPDFTLRGATRYGLLQTPVKLSDYRGQTVVLAFFYQARTKG